jgi:hypothetical protein
MIDKYRYFRFSAFAIAAGFFIIVMLFVSGIIELTLFYELLTAKILTSANYAVGILFLLIGFHRPDKEFLIIVFGGMVVRMFAMLIAIIISLKLLNLSEKTFIIIVFLFYFYFLTIEIGFLIKTNIKKNYKNDE